jgi:hypothetical protein
MAEDVKLNWQHYHEVVTTRPGGRIHRGNGKFEDANGNSLDPIDLKPILEQQRTELNVKLATLDADVKKTEEATLAALIEKDEKAKASLGK